jgi:hypothetical protein
MTDVKDPFNSRHWPKSIGRLDEYDGSDALCLGLWPGRFENETDRKANTKAWIATLPTLRHIKRLILWTHVNQPLFDAACALPRLKVLIVQWSNVENLDPITNLRGLRALSLGSSPRVKSIDPLTKLQTLRVLELENFKSVLDFSPLTKLKSLEQLSVHGGTWGKQAISGLEPFGAMTWLTSLSVCTSSVSSIRPLSQLKGLRTLGIGGRLPFEEYAWLSAKLPDTKCDWFVPYLEYGLGNCKSCQKRELVMLTGRRQPILCKQCQPEKIAKHVSLFSAVRESAKTEL